MSSMQYEFRVRLKIKNLLHEDAALDLLDKMGVKYETWGSDNEFRRTKDPHWDLHFGTKTGTIYIDYIIAQSELDDPFFDGALSMKELENILNQLPEGYSVKSNDGVKVVSYGYYTGVDEPEIF